MSGTPTMFGHIGRLYRTHRGSGRSEPEDECEAPFHVEPGRDLSPMDSVLL